jgi:hypothetical protein
MAPVTPILVFFTNMRHAQRPAHVTHSHADKYFEAYAWKNGPKGTDSGRLSELAGLLVKNTNKGARVVLTLDTNKCES